MGNAFGSLADDATSLDWNPAGLARARSPQILVMHALWLADTSLDVLAASFPWGNGSLGLGVTYLNYGTLTRLDAFGAEQGRFSSYDLNLALGYGYAWNERFRAGAAVKIPINQMDAQTQVSAGVDVGCQYRPAGWENGDLGFVLKDLGGQVGHGLPPSQIRISGDWWPVRDLVWAGEFGKYLNESSLNICTGLEYQGLGSVRPRVGYQLSSAPRGAGDGLTGLQAGLGFRQVLGGWILNLDYALASYALAGLTHRIALIVEIGPTQPLTKSAFAPAAESNPAATRAPVYAPAVTRAPAPSLEPEPQISTALIPEPQPLSPPSRLGCVRKGKYIVLRWQHTSSAAYSGYQVYLYSAKKKKYQRLNQTLLKDNFFSFKSVKSIHQYILVVRTVGPSGEMSEASPPATLTVK